MTLRHRLFLTILAVLAAGPASATTEATALRAWGVPSGAVQGPSGESQLRIMEAFKARHPDLERLEPATGLVIPGRTMDTQPLMQIAGDVSPDVIYVNFRQSDTYIRNKFLYPLDAYIEKVAGAEMPPDACTLDNDAYYALLSKGTAFEGEIRERMPRILWDVVRRECPYGAACPYDHLHGGDAAPAEHYHTWAVPQSQVVIALFYRRDVFAEAGLPDRVPDTCDEMLDWARRTTNPDDNTYGLSIPVGNTGWSTLSLLYSFGGRAVEEDADGVWRCAFDTDAAVDAYTFVARLFHEPYANSHGRFHGVVGLGDLTQPSTRYAMWFAYLDQRAFESIDPAAVGFGPVPKGPTGIRGSEYNCLMVGLYAGNVDDNPALRDLAWDYAWFIGGREANQIHTSTYVRNGLGRFIRPARLVEAGYPDEVRNVPPGWEEAYAAALEGGVPEPYGKNCQLVYNYMARGIDQILNTDEIKRILRESDGPPDLDRVRGIVRDILRFRVEDANIKMLGNLPADVRRFRARAAAAAVALIVVIFALVFRKVFRVFSKTAALQDPPVGGHRRRYLAYAMLLPALGTIALWAYWPLMRGTLMAFQDYNVRGFSDWVGLDNFAMVLFSHDFWHAMLVSVRYTVLMLAFGFFAPIILAILLSEVPRGKVLFRAIYYLPAVLSGVIVMFLWRGFYAPTGMLNQLVNGVFECFNSTFGTEFKMLTENWTTNPDTALVSCVIPTIWAGMGPGCLIYLAALKTVPDDIYEAADIDGAGILSKIRHITLPSIKMLVIINFIGATIGAMQSGSTFVLAMTGGGPYTPYGQTEVIGLHIFWEAFGYLRFGSATAMAWILGSMLIGFTVFQLQRLSRMEFRTVGQHGDGSAS
ncbi:MAG: extracellular solute-binding protein [Kiritimatiellia bacterium]|jgi:ABC-type sugar transport system permease subunit/ABC-type glycerol-3-phosphate transport system substrate-binding protein